MPARAFRALAGGPAALLVPSPAVPAATSRPEGLPPPAPSPVGAAHHIRIQSRAPIPAGLISALWSTASTRGGLTNTARHPARAGAWPRSLTDAPDAPRDHAGWEMPPSSSPNPSRPASRCAECLQLSAWLAALRCQLWAGQRPRAGSAVSFCLVPAAWEHPGTAQACPTGPSYTQDGAKPMDEPWWRSWVLACARVPPHFMRYHKPQAITRERGRRCVLPGEAVVSAGSWAIPAAPCTKRPWLCLADLPVLLGYTYSLQFGSW